MKKILLIPIILITLFTSCKKKAYLTDEQKALLLYNQGDSFSLIKNETDTLDFMVTKKEIDYDQDYNGLWKSATYYEHGSIEYYTNGIQSDINISSNQDGLGDNFGYYFLINTYAMIFKKYEKIQDYTLNDIVYRNCYLLIGYYDKDSMYISTDVGILYIKSEDGDEFKLLQK